VASFLNIALEYKAFNGLLGGLSSDSTEKLSFFEQQKRDLKAMFAKSVDANVDRSDEQTPFIVWFGGTVLLMIATFFIYSFYFSHFVLLIMVLFFFFNHQGNLVSQTMSQIGDVVQCYKTGKSLFTLTIRLPYPRFSSGSVLG
jgi:hypothetical protein